MNEEKNVYEEIVETQENTYEETYDDYENEGISDKTKRNLIVVGVAAGSAGLLYLANKARKGRDKINVDGKVGKVKTGISKVTKVFKRDPVETIDEDVTAEVDELQ